MTANQAFGWAKSPDDQLWHRVEMAGVVEDDPRTTEFHSACGKTFAASYLLGSKPIEDERPRCPICEKDDPEA